MSTYTAYHVRSIVWGDPLPNFNSSIMPKDDLPRELPVRLAGYDEDEIEAGLIETLEQHYKYKIEKIYWERQRL